MCFGLFLTLSIQLIHLKIWLVLSFIEIYEGSLFDHWSMMTCMQLIYLLTYGCFITFLDVFVSLKFLPCSRPADSGTSKYIILHWLKYSMWFIYTLNLYFESDSIYIPLNTINIQTSVFSTSGKMWHTPDENLKWTMDLKWGLLKAEVGIKIPVCLFFVIFFSLLSITVVWLANLFARNFHILNCLQLFSWPIWLTLIKTTSLSKAFLWDCRIWGDLRFLFWYKLECNNQIWRIDQVQKNLFGMMLWALVTSPSANQGQSALQNSKQLCWRFRLAQSVIFGFWWRI